MNDMRTLGNLIIEFRKAAHNDDLQGVDLLKRENFDYLTKALEVCDDAIFRNASLRILFPRVSIVLQHSNRKRKLSETFRVKVRRS